MHKKIECTLTSTNRCYTSVITGNNPHTVFKMREKCKITDINEVISHQIVAIINELLIFIILKKVTRKPIRAVGKFLKTLSP